MAKKKKVEEISVIEIIKQKIAELGDSGIERKRKQILFRQLEELEREAMQGGN